MLTGTRGLRALAFLAAFLVSLNVFSTTRNTVSPRERAGSHESRVTTTIPTLRGVRQRAHAWRAHRRAGVIDDALDNVEHKNTARVSDKKKTRPHALNDEALPRSPVRDDAGDDAVVSSKTVMRGGGMASGASTGDGEGFADDAHPFTPQEHTELGGDVVTWGSSHLQPTARACYEACLQQLVKNKKPTCNIWVWCPNPEGCASQKHKECWLKHQPRPQNAMGAKDASNPWISGTMVRTRTVLFFYVHTYIHTRSTAPSGVSCCCS